MMNDAGEKKIVHRIMVARLERDGKLVPGDSEDEPIDDVHDDGSDDPEEDVVADGEDGQQRPWQETLAACRETAEKSKAAANRRKSRKEKLSKDLGYRARKAEIKRKAKEERDTDRPGTVLDLEEEWRLAAQEKWPDVPSTWEPWDDKHNPAMWRGIFKKLIERKGYDGVCRLIQYAFKHWEDLIADHNLRSYPSAKLFASYADLWFPRVEGGEVRPTTPLARARRAREYDAERRSNEKGGVSYF